MSVAGSAPVLDLIDDFEDGNHAVRLINSPRRDGLWDVFNDGSGTQVPTPGKFVPVPLGKASAPYAGDTFAAYTKGSGFTSYGAVLKVDMRDWPVFADTPQYDASAYSGISFRARIEKGASPLLRIRFVSGDTDPRGNKCKAPESNPPQSELCFNHFFADVVLGTTWALYEVDFSSDFAQGKGGKLFPRISPDTMYGLEFNLPGGAPFELFLDDLSFIRK